MSVKDRLESVVGHTVESDLTIFTESTSIAIGLSDQFWWWETDVVGGLGKVVPGEE